MVTKEHLSTPTLIKRQPKHLQRAINKSKFPLTIKVTSTSKESHKDQIKNGHILTVLDRHNVETLVSISGNSQVVHIPVETSIAVLFAPIDGSELNEYPTVADLKVNIKQYEIEWVVVTSPFLYESFFYEVGQILQVSSQSRWRSFRKRYKDGLYFIVHPSQKIKYLPGYLKGFFKKCGSLYASKKHSLKDISTKEVLPYLIKFPYISENKNTLHLSQQTVYVREKHFTEVLIAVQQNNSMLEVHTFPSHLRINFEVLTDEKPVDKLDERNINLIKETMIYNDLSHAMKHYQVATYDDIGIETYLKAVGRKRSNKKVSLVPMIKKEFITAANILETNRLSYVSSDDINNNKEVNTDEDYEKFKRNKNRYSYHSVNLDGNVIYFDSEGYVDVFQFPSSFETVNPKQSKENESDIFLNQTDLYKQLYLTLVNNAHASPSNAHALFEVLSDEMPVDELEECNINQIKETMMNNNIIYTTKNYQVTTYKDFGSKSYLKAIGKELLSNKKVLLVSNPIYDISPMIENQFVIKASKILETDRHSYVSFDDVNDGDDEVNEDEDYEKFKCKKKRCSYDSVNLDSDVIDFDSEGYVDVFQFSSSFETNDPQEHKTKYNTRTDSNPPYFMEELLEDSFSCVTSNHLNNNLFTTPRKRFLKFKCGTSTMDLKNKEQISTTILLNNNGSENNYGDNEEQSITKETLKMENFISNQIVVSNKETICSNKDMPFPYKEKNITNVSTRETKISNMGKVNNDFINELEVVLNARKGTNTRELCLLTVKQVSEVLTTNKMVAHIKTFKRNQIDGNLLTALDEKSLQEFGLTPFEAKKLYCYINGWKPLRSLSNKIFYDNKDAVSWSIEDLSVHLKSILMDSLEEFTSTNDVDGVLMIEVLNNNLLSDLILSDGSTLKGFQLIKLKKYVFQGYRPSL